MACRFGKMACASYKIIFSDQEIVNLNKIIFIISAVRISGIKLKDDILHGQS